MIQSLDEYMTQHLPHTDEERAAWYVKDDRDADWALQMLHMRKQAMAAIDAEAEEKRAAIDAWQDDRIAQYERDATYFRNQLIAYAHSWDRDKRKSVKLVHGEVKTRETKASIDVIDAAKVIEWAKVNAPAAVKVTERLDRSALPEFQDDHGQLVLVDDEGTVTPVPGVALKPAHVSVTVNV